MRTDAADAPVGGQLEHHRVGEPEGTNASLADHDPDVSVADLLIPPEAAQAGVDGCQQPAHVVTPAKDPARSQRRNQLDVVGRASISASMSLASDATR